MVAVFVQLSAAAAARQLTMSISRAQFSREQGRGNRRTPRYIYNGSTASVTDTGVEVTQRYFARGAPGNAAAAEPIPTFHRTSKLRWWRGATGAGGQGEERGNPIRIVAAMAARLLTSAAGNRVIMGGGGGAGTRNNSSGTMGSGAAGGGVVIIRAGTITGSGTISVNGSDGRDADNDGGGGGGAGGSVVVYANSGGIGSLTVNARGGAGGDAWHRGSQWNSGQRHVRVRGAVVLSPIRGASTSVTGGATALLLR